MHVGARHCEAHARRSLQHGQREGWRVRLSQEIAWRQEVFRNWRRAPAGDAAPHSAHPAVHPRPGAGRARLFPHAAILACRVGREHRQPGPFSRQSLRGRRERRASRAVEGGAAGRISRSRPLSSSPGRALRRLRRQAAASDRRIARDGWPSVDALIHSGRQHGALRRRHRCFRSTRPAGHSGLRQRPGRSPGGRSLLQGKRCSSDRRAGVSHRFFPRRRPRLQ